MEGGYDLNKGFVEEVRHVANIVEVIGRHVQLRQRGGRWMGLCPFHDEKTPSFSVNPDRQMFYCFGCHAGGDVFKFLMQHENMGFPDAVVELAREAGLRIPRKSKQNVAREAEQSRLVEACEATLEWFRENLASDSGKAVREYMENRGMDAAACERFEIGWAPDSYDALGKALIKRFGKDVLIAAGIIQTSHGPSEHIDRFRKRIIIPIRSAGGRLVAFGGRIHGDGEPKYLNSPETALFNKSRILFGLHAGMRTIRKRGFAILVEGYFDAIALHLAGFENAVAPLGTSLTEEHAKLLRRYCTKTIVCMDADTAGKRAAVRSAAVLLEQGFAVNVVPLPEGGDPDDYVREHGADAFKELLKRSEPSYRYMLKSVAEKHDLTRPTGKRDALRELVPMLAKIGEPIERSESVSETARHLGIEQHLVTMELRAARAGQRRTGATAAPASVPKISVLTTAEKELLIASATNPAESEKAVEEFSVIEYVSPFARGILEALFNSGRTAAPANFTELTELAKNEDEQRLIAELAVSDPEHNRANARQCAAAIAIEQCRRRMAAISAEIADKEKSSPSDVEIDALYTEKMALSRRMYECEQALRENNPAQANKLAG